MLPGLKAQLEEHKTTEQEAVGSNPIQTKTTGILK